MSHIIEKDWTTQAGFRAVVLMQPSSHRCGYVGLPKTNILYGVNYNAYVPALRQYTKNVTLGQKSVLLILTASVGAPEGDTINASPEVIFDVHGGITFDSRDSNSYPVESDLWWFGFDCAHHGDAPEIQTPGYYLAGIHRTLEFCVAQCESLAQQISEKTNHITIHRDEPPSQQTS